MRKLFIIHTVCWVFLILNLVDMNILMEIDWADANNSFQSKVFLPPDARNPSERFLFDFYIFEDAKHAGRMLSVISKSTNPFKIPFSPFLNTLKKLFYALNIPQDYKFHSYSDSEWKFINTSWDYSTLTFPVIHFYQWK